MNKFSRLAASAVLSFASVGAASAATLTLLSYGSTALVPLGASNTATVYSGGPSYNVPTGGVWFGPLPGSSWVSSDPNAYPGGSVHPANGTYMFSTTFVDTTPTTSAGTITILADDTVTVRLNGVTIVTGSNGGAAPHCNVNTPNCMVPMTYNLSGFIAGTNVLTFAVDQQFDQAMGLDYVGSINTAVPEPGSLVLLGTGLVSSAGMFFRRFRA